VHPIAGLGKSGAVDSVVPVASLGGSALALPAVPDDVIDDDHDFSMFVCGFRSVAKVAVARVGARASCVLVGARVRIGGARGSEKGQTEVTRFSCLEHEHTHHSTSIDTDWSPATPAKHTPSAASPAPRPFAHQPEHGQQQQNTSQCRVQYNQATFA
jgi:hypothetical protein